MVAIGKAGALCVDVDQLGTGIVYISESKRVMCSTCRFNKTSCAHIKKVETELQLQPDPPLILRTYEKYLHPSGSVEARESQRCACRSWKRIPFHINESLQAIMHMKHSERFCAEEGTCVCILEPTGCMKCSSCNAEGSMVRELCMESTVILPNSVLMARGMHIL